MPPGSGLQAGEEGGGDGGVGVEAGGDVGGEGPGAVGDAVRAAVGVHEAGEGLGGGVGDRALGIGAGLAEAGDGEVDEFGVFGGEGVVADAEAGGDAWAEAFDEDVGLEGEGAEDGFCLGVLEVELEGALAAVEGKGHGGLGVVGEFGAEAAGPVAFGGFDLDDVGAVLGEEHGAVWGGDALAEVEDAQAAIGEGVAHGVCSRRLGVA